MTNHVHIYKYKTRCAPAAYITEQWLSNLLEPATALVQ